MPTTKPIAESGWTKQFPTTDGDYLCRINEDDLSPVSFRLENGAIYEYGCGKNLRSDYHHHAADYEFLGPFTASDFEQLIRLRKAGRDALATIQKLVNVLDFRTQRGMAIDADNVASALNEALARTGEQL